MKLRTIAPAGAAIAAFFAMAIAPGAAWAAGGSQLPPLVHDIGVSLLAAGVLAVVFARFKIPSIAAFLLAGILVGPLALHLVTDPESIETIAQIGLLLLLFMIGLELNVRKLFTSGRAVLGVGLMQFPLTLVFGLVVTLLLSATGLVGHLAAGTFAPFYVGAAIAGSSSLLLIKLFQQHFELDTRVGRLSLSILLFQDAWAIVITLLQPNLSHLEPWSVVFTLLGIAVLILLAFAFSKLVATAAFHWIAKQPELILLGAVAWCFIIVVAGTLLNQIHSVFGIDIHMSIGTGTAALIAGATIASLPFSLEITTKVSLVKDFFVTLFFVGLGMSIPAIVGWTVPLLALLIAVIAIIARQLVFFPLFYWFGVDQRNAEVTSVRLAQISEFGLVIAFLGVEQGHITPELSSAIILAFIFTAVLTSPLYSAAYAIYARVKPVLNRLGFTEPPEVEAEEREDVTLAILGFHRDASSLLHEVANTRPELLHRTRVIDFNVALHARIREMGVHVEYGDLSNEETLMHAGVFRAKIVLCTIPDELLRGISNRALVKILRQRNPEAIIVANAADLASLRATYEAGANYVYMARIEVAQALDEMLGSALEGTLDEYKAAELRRTGIGTRREVLS